MSEESQYVTELHPNDVLLGRGSGPNDHEGNIKLRELVAQRKTEYMSTINRVTKATISKEIVDAVFASNGRFLKKLEPLEIEKLGRDTGVDLYQVAEDDTIVEKVKQALRQNNDKKASTKNDGQKVTRRVQVDKVQKKIERLKGERDTLKRKNDSLEKDVARLCKNGRTIKDVERILEDHQALLDETEALREEKKKTDELARSDVEMRAALERTVESERLLAELTESVTAKLQAMKQVNEQLQLEIRTLAQANLDKNESS